MERQIPKREFIEEIHEKAQEMCNTIDQMLAEDVPYSRICDYIKEREAEGLDSWDQSVYILNRLAAIERAEIGSEVPRYLFEGRDTQELLRLYRIVVLLLRRLEFELPEEYQVECCNYLAQEQLSPIAIHGILRTARILIQKDQIWARLVTLMDWTTTN